MVIAGGTIRAWTATSCPFKPMMKMSKKWRKVRRLNIMRIRLRSLIIGQMRRINIVERLWTRMILLVMPLHIHVGPLNSMGAIRCCLVLEQVVRCSACMSIETCSLSAILLLLLIQLLAAATRAL